MTTGVRLLKLRETLRRAGFELRENERVREQDLVPGGKYAGMAVVRPVGPAREPPRLYAILQDGMPIRGITDPAQGMPGISINLTLAECEWVAAHLPTTVH